MLLFDSLDGDKLVGSAISFFKLNDKLLVGVAFHKSLE